MDLPAVVYYVPAAVVVSCEAEVERAQPREFDFTTFIKSSPREGWNNPLFFGSFRLRVVFHI